MMDSIRRYERRLRAGVASVWGVRDRIHATPATELVRRAAHARAPDEAVSVRCRPCRRELDLVMVATRPIDRATRRVLRREARDLAELPTVDGAVDWSARPQIVPAPDRRRWEAYDEAMQRITDRRVHIHRTAADLHVARQPALAEQGDTERLAQKTVAELGVVR